ncbi:MAG: DDE-type integrase/transposase/recombinase [Nitrospira sp.]|nr:DDE-type integrase/transposase/recombinase [Nitrospira sp.]
MPGAGGVSKRLLCLAVSAAVETRSGECAAGSGDPAAHVRTRQTYGPERLQAELHADGFPAGIGRIKRLRKKLGLRCTQVRRFTTTTDSTHALPVADNVLAQTVAATRPNETWVTDITYVPTAEGWLYLAGIKDLFTCEVVGHAMGARMTTELVSQALGAAVWAKRPHPGLIHHSDRGSQGGFNRSTQHWVVRRLVGTC